MPVGSMLVEVRLLSAAVLPLAPLREPLLRVRRFDSYPPQRTQRDTEATEADRYLLFNIVMDHRSAQA